MYICWNCEIKAYVGKNLPWCPSLQRWRAARRWGETSPGGGGGPPAGGGEGGEDCPQLEAEVVVPQQEAEVVVPQQEGGVPVRVEEEGGGGI